MLIPGTRLGPYEILAPLGSGGMGEVYRARDTKLAREVALKVLPDLFAHDPDRLARFQQEARLLAALNHPHIAAIYGLEEAVCEEPSGRGASGARMAPVRFLVLELVPGETLAERIARGALQVEEALAVCRQIAEALEAAHDKGIIHRDLKPANVKITPEGQVKVLDFGLAKAFAPQEASPGSAPVDLTQSPTLTTPATQVGVILGTAAYMSPEQARGRPVDKRADIWAFGCVLYEALAGRQAFEGETLSDTLAAILKTEPDWGPLPLDAGSRLRELLKRCLRKDPGQRLRDIGDARLEIETAIAAGSSGAAGEVDTGSSHRRRASLFILWTVAGVMAAVAVALLWFFRVASVVPQASGRPVHLSVALPPSTRLPSFTGNLLAISPDGSDLIYVASTGNDSPRLYRRTLSSPTATPMPDTEGAWGPFFSPDGKWVGFLAGRKLRKTPVTGGSTITICAGCEGIGFAWGPDGSILSGTSGWELKSVSAAGGEPRSVLTLGEQAPFSQGFMAWPQVIDDEGSVLCSLRGGAQAFDQAMLGIVRVRGNSGAPRVTRLPERGTCARYVPTGHILFVRGGTLLAMPFEVNRATVVGPAVPVLEGVAVGGDDGAAQYAVSDNGTLAYIPGGGSALDLRLVWVDRQGREEVVAGPARPFVDAALSPDGRRLAVGVQAGAEGSQDVWIQDFDRGTLGRVTFDAAADMAPIWSPDGKWLVYTSGDPDRAIMRRAADGSDSAEEVARFERVHYPSSVTPDGRTLVLVADGGTTHFDIVAMDLDGQRKIRPILATPFDEYQPAVSPDGRWLAYASNESGRKEVYVRPFDGPGGKRQVSMDGGIQPRWSRNGRELFYRGGAGGVPKLLSAAVASGPTLRIGQPGPLFEDRYEAGGYVSNYDVAPDGRFLMVKGSAQSPAVDRIEIILNWFEELKRLAPVGGW